jgi:MtN3 and saliva related transmembrane protein
VTQIIGIIAGVFTATSLLPQLIKILKEKKAEDVSIAMLLVLMTGVSLWIYYGFLREDAPIIVTNCFSLLLNIITLYYRLKYKKS